MKRNIALLCLLSLCALVSVLRAETSGTSRPAASAAFFAALTGGSAPEARSTCPNIRCSSSIDCENACPAALSATCGATTHACTYTFSGGGGGGGVTCPSSRCATSSECSCHGHPGTCVLHACQY
jgi:hypothetical protein